MFFIMGINNGQKELNFKQLVICDKCGRYGNYVVYMTYTVLSLFFIPCFKWGKQYYVRMSCCGTTYRLKPEIGKRIAKGEQVEIIPEDLELMGRYNPGNGWSNQGYNSGSSWSNQNYNGNYGSRKCCPNCGFSTEEDFDYCPKCGRRL